MLNPLLVLLALPFVAAAIGGFIAGKDRNQAARWAVVAGLGIFVFGLWTLGTGAPVNADPVPWFSIAGATVHFHLVSDALSTWLIHLVNLLVPLCLLAARRPLNQRLREFVIAGFAMQGALIGALLAADLVLFYLFFEAMLAPMLVMVVLGGDRDRRGAALQFFLYTMAGSIFLLVGILYLAAATGTTEIARLATVVPERLGPQARGWCFLAFALAFAVKTPLVPFHSWQARVYGAAPAAATALLAGAMAKLGLYGFLRLVVPIFPAESVAWAPCIQWLCLLGIVGGALIALVQRDLKKVLAFSSLSHLSLAVLGIFSFSELAMVGAIVLMVAHGLSVAALFLLVGYLEHRRGRREIEDFGGIVASMPRGTVLFVIAVLCAVAMPGTAAFIGEFLILMGVAQAGHMGLGIASVAGLTLILGAAYLLRVVQRVFLGRPRERMEGLRPSEALPVIPLVALAFGFGFYPLPLIQHSRAVARVTMAPAQAELTLAHQRAAAAAEAAEARSSSLGTDAAAEEEVP